MVGRASLVGLCAAVGGAASAEAIMQMPDKFNAMVDFQEKEKYQLAKPHIKCEICKVVLGQIMQQTEKFGGGRNESFQQSAVFCACRLKLRASVRPLAQLVSNGYPRCGFVMRISIRRKFRMFLEQSEPRKLSLEVATRKTRFMTCLTACARRIRHSRSGS